MTRQSKIEKLNSEADEIARDLATIESFLDGTAEGTVLEALQGLEAGMKEITDRDGGSPEDLAWLGLTKRSQELMDKLKAVQLKIIRLREPDFRK